MERERSEELKVVLRLPKRARTEKPARARSDLIPEISPTAARGKKRTPSKAQRLDASPPLKRKKKKLGREEKEEREERERLRKEAEAEEEAEREWEQREEVLRAREREKEEFERVREGQREREREEEKVKKRERDKEREREKEKERESAKEKDRGREKEKDKKEKDSEGEREKKQKERSSSRSKGYHDSGEGGDVSPFLSEEDASFLEARDPDRLPTEQVTGKRLRKPKLADDGVSISSPSSKVTKRKGKKGKPGRKPFASITGNDNLRNSSKNDNYCGLSTIVLEAILDKLQKKDTYGVFAEPVDASVITDYYDVIKQPMDFGTMRKGIANGEYTNWDDFQEHVLLICSNAMLYNQANTIYHKQARAMKEMLPRLLQASKEQADGLMAGQVLQDGEPQRKRVIGGAGGNSRQAEQDNYGVDENRDLKVGDSLAGEEREVEGGQWQGDVSKQAVEKRVASGTGKFNSLSSGLDGRIPKRLGGKGKTGVRSVGGRIKAGGSKAWMVKGGNDGARFMEDEGTGGRRGAGIDRQEDGHEHVEGSLLEKQGESVVPMRPSKPIVNRRMTYQPRLWTGDGYRPSLAAPGGESRLLVVTGSQPRFAYAQSLARFAAKLGKVGWAMAEEKIRTVLGPDIPFGRGWVEQRDGPVGVKGVPPKTTTMTPVPRTSKVSQSFENPSKPLAQESQSLPKVETPVTVAPHIFQSRNSSGTYGPNTQTTTQFSVLRPATPVSINMNKPPSVMPQVSSLSVHTFPPHQQHSVSSAMAFASRTSDLEERRLSLPSSLPPSFPPSRPSSLSSALPSSHPSSLPSSVPSAIPLSLPPSFPPAVSASPLPSPNVMNVTPADRERMAGGMPSLSQGPRWNMMSSSLGNSQQLSVPFQGRSGSSSQQQLNVSRSLHPGNSNGSTQSVNPMGRSGTSTGMAQTSKGGWPMLEGNLQTSKQSSEKEKWVKDGRYLMDASLQEQQRVTGGRPQAQQLRKVVLQEGFLENQGSHGGGPRHGSVSSSLGSMGFPTSQQYTGPIGQVANNGSLRKIEAGQNHLTLSNGLSQPPANFDRKLDLNLGLGSRVVDQGTQGIHLGHYGYHMQVDSSGSGANGGHSEGGRG